MAGQEIRKTATFPGQFGDVQLKFPGIEIVSRVPHLTHQAVSSVESKCDDFVACVAKPVSPNNRSLGRIKRRHMLRIEGEQLRVAHSVIA